MTCHNRKELTLRCLDRLYAQDDIENVNIDVFLVDDGSTDGTPEAVASAYPLVHLLHGDGSLFWTGGMRRAMEAASNQPFDHYLWLNDDTLLYPDALSRLLDTHSKLCAASAATHIIVGSLCDPDTGELTYGGSVRVCSWHPLRFAHVEPEETPRTCDVFNGNVLLVSAGAAETLGNLHAELVHSGGDYEYGLRAGEMGVQRWVAPGYFGECPRNSIEGTWLDASLSLKQRYKALFSTKGQPIRPRFMVYSRYGGPFWPVLFPLIYLRPLATSVRRLFGR
jgi:GT2 family glycosyltransferase